MGMDLRLRPLAPGDSDEAVRAHAELAADGFWFLLSWEPGDDWAAYLDELERQRRGADLPPGLVPATFLVAVLDGEIVGRVSIRHRLNANLLAEGGHIGYGVRPAWRRRGLASEILRQSLIVARAVGVAEALLVCDERNVGSARVIERMGGQLEDVRRTASGARNRRYWIR